MGRAIRKAAGMREQKAEKSMRRLSYVLLLCTIAVALISNATAKTL